MSCVRAVERMGVDIRDGGCGWSFFGGSALGPEKIVCPFATVEFRRTRVVGGIVTEVFPVRDASSVATYFLFNSGGESHGG